MDLKQRLIHHLIPFILFFIITSIFFAPLYSGKVLVQSDNIQLSGPLKEVTDYREKGESISWTNKEFSGLPILSGSEYNLFIILHRAVFQSFIPKIIMMVVALFLGFYILMQVVGTSRWFAALGALAFAYSTFNIISIEAGHDNKVLAMAFMAPTLAGVIKAYNQRYLQGALLTCVSAGFQLVYGHIQITYYLFLMVLAYLIVVIYQHYRSGEWRNFMRATAYLAGAALIAVCCNFGKLYSTIEYSRYSTRGGSELESSGISTGGLDKDYAWSWSNGIMETFTVMFPYFHGGASGESLSEDSETFSTLRSRGVDLNTIQNVTSRVPLYWGDQPFTVGPLYFGITIILLFVLSFFVLNGPFKWWGISLTIFGFLLAMGKNLEGFNSLLFDYLPLYNKFRSVTMSFSISQLIVPLLGFMALEKLVSGTSPRKENSRVILQSLIIVGGIAFIFLLFKNAFFDFRGVNDAQYFSQFPEWLSNAIVRDRKALFSSDLWRGIIFVILLGGLLWYTSKNEVKRIYLVVSIGVLIMIDLLAVNRRYISTDEFDRPRAQQQNIFQPSQADLAILQDTSYYRVFNTTRRLDQDGLTSYHHFSVGGYNAIKMQRYQELIERYISQGQRSALNMLNVKYLIVQDESGSPRAQRNSGALGNAWLVNTIEVLENADAEIDRVEEVDLTETAITDKRFAGYLDGQSNSFSGLGTIELKSYHPENMTYSFQSESDQFAVFSEVYYKPGWNAYVDGEIQDYIRVNYILRGMLIPSGNHEIVFKYEPVSEVLGNWLAIVFSFTVIALTGFVIFKSVKKGASEKGK